MYLYPNNLKAKATLWFWELKDIGIIGVGLLFSVFAYSKLGMMLPTVIVLAYAFLSIKAEDISILDYLKYAFSFLILHNQTYEWSFGKELNNEKGC